MIKHATQIYKNLKIVSDKVRESLHNRGVVIPVENQDGSISLGKYQICKSRDFYQIKTHTGEIVQDGINLPQTAILVANGLALGKFTNYSLLALDRQYGYAAFEEALHTERAKKAASVDYDRSELLLTRSSINHNQKIKHRRCIEKSFEKLLGNDK